MITDNSFFKITDPITNPIGSSSSYYSQIENRDFRFLMPDHIISNNDKKAYKTGFLDEFFSLFYPNKQRKEIYELVTKEFDIFVSERQYRYLVAEYHKKKYTDFIKK